MTTPTEPTAITAAPDVPDSSVAEPTFDSQFEAFLSYLKNTLVAGINASLTNAYTNALSAFESASAALWYSNNASASAATAAIAANAAAAAANATVWVSGTTYAQGDVRWSPTSFQSYRRKTNGAGTTDPAGDATNWEPLNASGGISTAASITTSTTLTSASAGYQRIAMTAMGQSVTLPDATTLAIGAPKFYLDNSAGGYPVGIRNSSGTLLMAIAAGGTAYANCEDISTAAGVWAITGTNLEPGLITIDNTFSSTYDSTVLKPFVALDDNKSIHFLSASGAGAYYAVCVDKTTGAVGTPVLLVAASRIPFAAFKITSTTAIVFYGSVAGNLLRAAVISLSGSTTLAVGTPSTELTAAGVAAEDFSGAPKIAQLDGTHYLLSYATATGAGTTSVAALEITSGTTATWGSPVNIITANNVVNSTTTYALTATTGLVIYLDDAAAPYSLNAVVISVSGTTCTVGAPATVANIHAWPFGGTLPSSCLLSATKALLLTNNNDTNVYVYAASISGTTVTFGAACNVEAVAAAGTAYYTGNSATRYNPHLFPLSASTALLWYLDSSNVSRAVVLSESGGTVTKGTILYLSISVAAQSATGGGSILPQGTTEFVSLKSQTAQAGDLQLVPHKIAGTTITYGHGTTARDLPPTRPEYCSFTRLSAGDYVFTSGLVGNGGGEGKATRMLVYRSNGDVINVRGSIGMPPITGDYTPIPKAVSGNRLVILGDTSDGTTVSSSTKQLRLLNVEIAT